MPRKPIKKSPKYSPDELIAETQRLKDLVDNGEYPSFYKASITRNPRFSKSALYRVYKQVVIDHSKVKVLKKGRQRAGG